MDHHRFPMIQGLWLQAAFRAVGFSLGMSSWMLLKLLNQSEERERTPFPAFMPRCCCCCVFQLRRTWSLEQKTWAHVFGHRSRMVAWITVWNRSTPHSACLNHRREPVSTGIGLILFPVWVKQPSLKAGISFCMKQVSCLPSSKWLLRK